MGTELFRSTKQGGPGYRARRRQSAWPVGEVDLAVCLGKAVVAVRDTAGAHGPKDARARHVAPGDAIHGRHGGDG
eukprot:3197289-Pleurochrysis_carterae.AAC.1